MTTTYYTVGQQVYVSAGKYHIHWMKGTVTKVTPGGAVDVKIGDSEPIRFRNGKNAGGHYELDTLSFEARERSLRLQKAQVEAANVVNAVTKDANRVNANWGKDGMLSEINRLQKLLDEARVVVEALELI